MGSNKITIPSFFKIVPENSRRRERGDIGLFTLVPKVIITFSYSLATTLGTLSAFVLSLKIPALEDFILFAWGENLSFIVF